MGVQIEKKSYPVKLTVIVISAIILLSGLITFAMAAYDMSGVASGGKVTVAEGMTVSQVAGQMKESGIVRFPTAFKLLSRYGGYDKDIKAGTVIIDEGMSYKEILNRLVNPTEGVIKITIPEGYEVKEIAERFSEIVSIEEFYEALEYNYNYSFLNGIPDRETKLEGYLFPATYEFLPGTPAEQVIDIMLKTFDEHFPEEYYARAEELGMTVDEVVTLASIIEREAVSDEDRGKISGVFHNRLKKNMRLQSCATVQYILKERKSVLSVEDTKIESPYNTYINKGLPVGPISSPGSESIKAALYPEKTTALYFVLGSDGKHIFSDNYNDHLDAKNGE